jgi:glycosyltransferase involved in cell wall biosynthesis
MTVPRVLQVVLSLAPGGTERLVLDLVRRLRDRMPMAVCCLDEEGAWGRELAAEGIVVTALRRTPGFHPSLGREVARAARAHGATVVHAHHYSPFVYSAVARLWGGPSRVIFTEHGRLSDRGPSRKRRLANRLLGAAATRVFTVSRELGEHIVQEGLPRRKVSVIYNGIDVGPLPDAAARREVRARLGADDGELVIGTIARLDPVKDLGTLIRAVGVVARSVPARLVIVGDGEERVALERAAAETGTPGLVRFLGHRDDARMWLAGCDVYANSSISEGISLTILEAMAAGLPIVATSVGGTPEIVDSSCGRVVPSRDAGALAAALVAVDVEPGVRRALGAAARLRVERDFPIERMVGEYAAAYEAR